MSTETIAFNIFSSGIIILFAIYLFFIIAQETEKEKLASALFNAGIIILLITLVSAIVTIWTAN